MALIDYCNTELQKQCARAVEDHGSERAAAKALGVSRDTLRGSLRSPRHRMRKAAEDARQGYSPEHGLNMSPMEGYYMPNATVQYNPKTGEVERAWPRYREDTTEAHNAALAFLEDLPRIPDQPFTLDNFDTDVIPWYQIGDGHLGMLANKSETRQDFDLGTAVEELMVAMATLIDETRPTERCVIQDCGDMAHFENAKKETERGGHALDTSCSLPELIRARRKVMRFIIERALTKSKYVDIIINQGNHSRSMDWAMADTLAAVYEDSERVTVLDNDSIFIPYRMGNTFVMCTHTDKLKPTAAAGVMANMFSHDWGETRYHYIDGGHVHHKQSEKELNGATYQSWNQLAPNDKHAHDAGYGSRQCLCVVERSKTYGEQARRTLTRERVRDIIENVAPGTNVQRRNDVYTV